MPEATTIDGRVLRGERNRDAIVDALLELLAEGETSPSSREIAQRAGVSLRTVFQHFDDIDTLYAAVAQLFEVIGPVRRAAAGANSTSPALLRGLARSEAFLRRQIAETFEPELEGDADRLAAADFAASWEAWEGLRRASRRSVPAASRILRVLLLAVLDPR